MLRRVWNRGGKGEDGHDGEGMASLREKIIAEVDEWSRMDRSVDVWGFSRRVVRVRNRSGYNIMTLRVHRGLVTSVTFPLPFQPLNVAHSKNPKNTVIYD